MLVLSASFGIVEAKMSSTNYEIRFDGFHYGASETESSSSYQLHSGIEAETGDRSTSSSYTLSSGYREGIYDPVVDFDVYVQNTASQTAVTALSSNTATVTDVSSFSVGDMIAIIQNEGASQVSAFGKIDSVSGSNVTVDFWSNSGSTPAIDGVNDYAYELTGSSLSFGSLSDSSVSTGILAWEVNADIDDGYSVYVYEDQDLQNSAATASILDVSDGSVTAGSSEYGGISSDATLISTFDTVDTAFTTSLQQVASRSNNAIKARDFLTLKIAVSTDQDVASYSSTLTLVYVGNY